MGEAIDYSSREPQQTVMITFAKDGTTVEASVIRTPLPYVSRNAAGSREPTLTHLLTYEVDGSVTRTPAIRRPLLLVVPAFVENVAIDSGTGE